MADRLGLAGKVAVITGATGGWGTAAAIGLAERGAAVVLNSRSQHNLEAMAAELRRSGATCAAVEGDIRTLAGARSIMGGAVHAFGTLDILVNAAGMTARDQHATGGVPNSLLDLTEDAWNHMIATELTGVYTCTKAAVERMVEHGRGGRVITVGGGAGMYGIQGDGSHAAAKGGVASAMWSWCDHLRTLGITFNCTRGGVRSNTMDAGAVTRWQSILAPDGDESTRDARTFGFFEPTEAAPLVTWMASDLAADFTGCYIGIDGPKLTLWEPMAPDTALFQFPRWSAETIGEALGPLLRRRGRRMHPTDLLTSELDYAQVVAATGAVV